MFVLETLFLLLPIAAASGWYAGYKHHEQHENEGDTSLEKEVKFRMPKDYFVGLNYLLNDQPDRAVDVFIKMLRVDEDTIETHLALGSLFRRRGEVDRAIRIHQNVIARPHITHENHVKALSELGLDYLRAGLLDRAEKLFLELVDLKAETETSCNYLLGIYQLQKDWAQAINMAERLMDLANKDHLKNNIAHFYCELAENAVRIKDIKSAKEHLQQALKNERSFVRAYILLGNIAHDEKDYAEAIDYYQKVIKFNSPYLSEVIQPLGDCYKSLQKDSTYINLLTEILPKARSTLVVVALADNICNKEGPEKAVEFLLHVLEKFPSLGGINLLLNIYMHKDSQLISAQTLNHTDEQTNELGILHKFISKLLISKANYRCSQCGFSSKVLYWQCPGCKIWEGMKAVEDL